MYCGMFFPIAEDSIATALCSMTSYHAPCYSDKEEEKATTQAAALQARGAWLGLGESY